MASVLDYVGRTVDVSAFFGGVAGTEKLVRQTIFPPGSGGELVTGPAKACQRFLMLLLTINGSIAYLPERGCQFMADALRGLWRTPADVDRSFAFSRIDVLRQLLAEQGDAAPPDEQVAEAALLSVGLAGGMATLRIALTTAAGDSIEFIAPIRVTLK